MTDREKFEAWFVGVAAEMQRFGAKDLEIAHRKAKDWFCWQAALASQQPADDGWIEWAGGECPLSANNLVNVRYREGGEDLESKPAEVYNWSRNDKDCYPIIAYRVVKP